MYNNRTKVWSPRRTYPENWKTLKAAGDTAINERCFYCKKTKHELKKVGKWLERHHLNSVATGNNRRLNLVKACAGPRGGCHDKQGSSIKRRFLENKNWP